jgi:XTP/dITP diphosphohydrolase
LFFCPELGKTFAEATVAEKRLVSHRGRALAQMIRAFQQGQMQLG